MDLAKVQIFRSEFSVRALKVLFFLSLAVMIGSYALYSISLAMDLPMGDHWRWIRGLLIPLTDGRISFWEYITGEFYPLSHSHMVTLGFVWLNYNFFGLDYSLEFYIGLVSHVVLMVWMAKVFYNEQGLAIGRLSTCLVIIVFYSILFSPINVVAWSLVQFEYFYLLSAFAFFVLFSSCMDGRLHASIFILILIPYFFLGDAMGVSAMASVMGYILLFELKARWRFLIGMVFVVGVCYLISHLIIPNMHPHTNISKTDSVLYLINHPAESVAFVIKACAQSITSMAALKHVFGQDFGQLIQNVVGVFVLGFVLLATGLYFCFRRVYEISSIPMLMIAFTVATLLGVMMSRLPTFGPDVAQAARYLRLFQFGLVGALWINLVVFVRMFNGSGLAHRAAKVGFSCLVAVFISSFFVHSVFLWKYQGSIVKNRQNALEALRTYAIDPDFDIGSVEGRCKNDFCKTSVLFLKENDLSIFRKQ